MLVAVMLCVQCLVKLTQIRFLNAYFLVIYHDTQCLIVNNTSVFMLSRLGIWFFQMFLCFPDLGFCFSRWFYPFLIWDFVFPSGFVCSRFGMGSPPFLLPRV